MRSVRPTPCRCGSQVGGSQETGRPTGGLDLRIEGGHPAMAGTGETFRVGLVTYSRSRLQATSKWNREGFPFCNPGRHWLGGGAVEETSG